MSSIGSNPYAAGSLAQPLEATAQGIQQKKELARQQAQQSFQNQIETQRLGIEKARPQEDMDRWVLQEGMKAEADPAQMIQLRKVWPHHAREQNRVRAKYGLPPLDENAPPPPTAAEQAYLAQTAGTIYGQAQAMGGQAGSQFLAPQRATEYGQYLPEKVARKAATEPQIITSMLHSQDNQRRALEAMSRATSTEAKSKLAEINHLENLKASQTYLGELPPDMETRLQSLYADPEVGGLLGGGAIPAAQGQGVQMNITPGGPQPTPQVMSRLLQGGSPVSVPPGGLPPANSQNAPVAAKGTFGKTESFGPYVPKGVQRNERRYQESRAEKKKADARADRGEVRAEKHLTLAEKADASAANKASKGADDKGLTPTQRQKLHDLHVTDDELGYAKDHYKYAIHDPSDRGRRGRAEWIYPKGASDIDQATMRKLASGHSPQAVIDALKAGGEPKAEAKVKWLTGYLNGLRE